MKTYISPKILFIYDHGERAHCIVSEMASRLLSRSLSPQPVFFRRTFQNLEPRNPMTFHVKCRQSERDLQTLKLFSSMSQIRDSTTCGKAIQPKAQEESKSYLPLKDAENDGIVHSLLSQVFLVPTGLVFVWGFSRGFLKLSVTSSVCAVLNFFIGVMRGRFEKTETVKGRLLMRIEKFEKDLKILGTNICVASEQINNNFEVREKLEKRLSELQKRISAFEENRKERDLLLKKIKL